MKFSPVRTVPAATDDGMCLGALAAGAAGLAAGVSGLLKGCATPGLDVAAGAPVAERGVEVVVVSVVTGVERVVGVVVKVRVALGMVVGVRSERRVRQRVQIIVVWWARAVVELEVRVPVGLRVGGLDG